MKKKWLWIVIGLVAIIALVAIAFTLKQVNSGSSKKDKGYDTYEVKKENPINIEGKASPNAVKTYNNNSQVGDFQNALVKDGQKVKQGDKLINYDTNSSKRQELANKVDQAQNQVNDDQEQANQRPNDKDVQSKLTQDQSSLNEAQQQLSQHDKQLNDSMYASFDGKVNIKNDGEVGDGEPILQLISNDPQIKSTVSEYDLDKIHTGDKVNVSVTSNGKKGHGKINKINELPTSYDDSTSGQSAGSTQGEDGQDSGASQASNPVQNDPSGGKEGDTSKYTVIIGDLDIPVRSGLSMDASIPLNTMKLPDSVLTKDDKVFVVDSHHKAHKRNIKIERNNGQIIVKEGLKAGDKVIKHPKKTLNDGAKVEVSS
ncbi:efflux RND transporter periplasmic adaptor subunit [Staphylococcus kloosii]|nr:efflux RND transporter periplasmic adaptor subunit [Staphylococcus kloosii]MBF7025417.1 efflux RND transporter periplasmic adaptor subunit [Staphylococcus kloosii]